MSDEISCVYSAKPTLRKVVTRIYIIPDVSCRCQYSISTMQQGIFSLLQKLEPACVWSKCNTMRYIAQRACLAQKCKSHTNKNQLSQSQDQLAALVFKRSW